MAMFFGEFVEVGVGVFLNIADTGTFGAIDNRGAHGFAATIQDGAAHPWGG